MTFSSVVTASTEDAVEQGSLGDNEVQLVPVTGSVVLPGYYVSMLGGEQCLGYVEVMERA